MKDSPSADLLEAMNNQLSHRGPDDSSTYIDGAVGFGHKRLSIIDPETGSQPIFNEDDSVVAIFNGELYNYKILRSELRSAGHSFSTKTDGEVLVHLYEEYGASFVKRLDGMYAFALWDSNTRQLLLVRDPMGIKPLVIARTGSQIGFASEIPALFPSGIDLGGINGNAIAQYFAFGYIPAPQSAFNNVSKLKPGEVLVISESEIQSWRHGTPNISTRTPDFGEAVGELRKRVRESVRKRLQSDVPLGAFLSGGIDSSIVVGTMAELTDEQIDTFTVGFDEHMFDESWAAREVADWYETNHHEYVLAADDLRKLIPSVLNQLGEPFADPSLIPSYLIAKETKNEVKVALSGDGADELFAGYDKYRAEFLSKYYRAIPPSLRSVGKGVVGSLPATRDTRVGELAHSAQWFANRGESESVPERHFEWMRIPQGNARDAFRSVDPETVGRQVVAEEHAKTGGLTKARDPLTRIQVVDTRLSLPNQMLQKVDLASMYNSLEVRVPFLDQDIVEYTLSLPVEFKITPRKRKRLLKQAFDDVLPNTIQERGKQGFDMPIGEWFKDELADEFVDLVRSTNSRFLNDEVVLDVFDEHVSNKGEHTQFLWSVFVFKRWVQQMRAQNVLD